MEDELKYSFLTIYKRLHFLIRIFHINPASTKIPFSAIIKDAFDSQFIARKSIYSGANIYKWKTIK